MATIGRTFSSLRSRKFLLSNGTKSFQRSLLTPVPAHNPGNLNLVCPEKLAETPPEYPGYKVCKEDFKYVEMLLPKDTVPSPPPESLMGLPTPSGWVPPNENGLKHPYFVKRTKNHMLPLYLDVKYHGTRPLTKICRIDGNIWKLESDLRKYLQERSTKQIYTQVHEVSSFIRVRGDYCEDVCKFLLSKGF